MNNEIRTEGKYLRAARFWEEMVIERRRVSSCKVQIIEIHFINTNRNCQMAITSRKQFFQIFRFESPATLKDSNLKIIAKMKLVKISTCSNSCLVYYSVNFISCHTRLNNPSSCIQHLPSNL